MPLAMALATDNKENQVNQPPPEVIHVWDEIKKIGVEGPKFDPADIVFIGVRDTEEPEEAYMNAHNIKNFKTEDVRAEGPLAIAEKALAHLSECEVIYISFDVDSLDSSISVGTGTPVPNGLTVEEAKIINETLVRDPKVCAWEIVEVNPTLDSENKMAEVAFEILEATTNSAIKAKAELVSN
jgi:arginase